MKYGGSSIGVDFGSIWSIYNQNIPYEILKLLLKEL